MQQRLLKNIYIIQIIHLKAKFRRIMRSYIAFMTFALRMDIMQLWRLVTTHYNLCHYQIILYPKITLDRTTMFFRLQISSPLP